jgi:hypothetical protein
MLTEDDLLFLKGCMAYMQELAEKLEAAAAAAKQKPSHEELLAAVKRLSNHENPWQDLAQEVLFTMIKKTFDELPADTFVKLYLKGGQVIEGLTMGVGSSRSDNTWTAYLMNRYADSSRTYTIDGTSIIGLAVDKPREKPQRRPRREEEYQP